MAWPRLWSSRDRAELERLRASEARYRLLAEHARDVIVQYDATGIIHYASPSVASFDSAGPPGYGSPRSRAPLSNASPAASSMVEPRRR